jgi:hypothetical protein
VIIVDQAAIGKRRRKANRTINKAPIPQVLQVRAASLCLWQTHRFRNAFSRLPRGMNDILGLNPLSSASRMHYTKD